MQRASDELFSGSVFACDEDASRCCRDFFNLLHQRAHHGTLADDLEGRVDGLAQPSVLLLEIEIRERIAQHHENPICIERFLQNLVRAGLSCLNRGANCGVATNHHNEGRWIELADTLERLHAVHAGHFDVEEHEMGTPLLKLGDAVRRAGNSVNVVSLVLEQLAERRTNALLVINDQYTPAQRTLLYRVILPLAIRTSVM